MKQSAVSKVPIFLFVPPVLILIHITHFGEPEENIRPLPAANRHPIVVDGLTVRSCALLNNIHDDPVKAGIVRDAVGRCDRQGLHLDTKIRAG